MCTFTNMFNEPDIKKEFRPYLLTKSSCKQEKKNTEIIREVFGDLRFKITIENDMFKKKNFVGFFLCLRIDTFQPYRKNNCNVMYINNRFNHS